MYTVCLMFARLSVMSELWSWSSQCRSYAENSKLISKTCKKWYNSWGARSFNSAVWKSTGYVSVLALHQIKDI